MPSADKYFHRELSGFETARMFQYAVETDQRGIAYACLTPESQEKLTFARFVLALELGHLDEYRGIAIRDLITRAVVFPPDYEPERDGTVMVVPSSYVDEERGVASFPNFYFEWIPSADDPAAGEWRFDIDRTLRALAR